MGKMRLPFIDSDFYIEATFKTGLTVVVRWLIEFTVLQNNIVQFSLWRV